VHQRHVSVFLLLLSPVFLSCGAARERQEPSSDGEEVRAKVNAAMREAGTFEFHGEMTFEGLGPGASVARLEGFYDFDGPRLRLVTEPVSDGDEDPNTTEEGGEQRLIGDVFYTFPHLLSRGSEFRLQQYWLEQPADVATSGSSLPLTDQIGSLLTVPEGFEVESETNNGEETTFEGVVGYGGDPPRAVVALDLKGRVSVTTNEDDLPVRLQWSVDQKGPDGRITMNIEILFENFGAKQVVEPPPSKRTVTLEEYETLMEGYSVPVDP
jgi:hypothetical protein